MAENKPPYGKEAGRGAKKSGGVWGFLNKVIESVKIDINVGPPGLARQPAGDPTDPAARMDPLRQDRKETYDELIYRSTHGAAGQAPAVRMDRERQQVARSLDRRSRQPADSATIPKGGGEPLAKDVRARMEPALGADLSSVEVHRASESAAAAEGLNAKAFAVGQDVHFGSGQCQPGTKEGDRLLAHELTHVVQDQRSGIQRKPQDSGDAAAAGHDGGADAEANVSSPNEPAEQEADAVADEVSDKLHGADAREKHAAAAGKDAGANVAEKPAAIAATFDGVSRKIFRSSSDKKDAKPKVDKPVPGLFGQIDPMSTPPGWNFQDEWPPPKRDRPSLVMVITTVTDPQGKTGDVIRGYDKDKKQFEMISAFLIAPGADKGTGVQSMIEHKDPVMITGRGTPTQTFITLRQMKMLQQHAGMNVASLEKVKMSTIQNVEGICQLNQALRKGAKPHDLMTNNESRRYAETTLTQAGKRIKSAKVIGGVWTPFKELLEFFERDGDKKKPENFGKLLQKYGLTRDDRVLWNYDIEFEVMPFEAKT